MAKFENPGSLNTACNAAAICRPAVRSQSATALASSPNPSLVGHTVKFTAKVSPVCTVNINGTDYRAGVTFYEGSTSLGTAGEDAGGYASITVSNFKPGQHDITAKYGGITDPFTSNSCAASTSSQLTQKVGYQTATSLSPAGPNPSTYGQSVTFTATVSPVVPGTVV